jgi:predicted secreted hydrolase
MNKTILLIVFSVVISFTTGCGRNGRSVPEAGDASSSRLSELLSPEDVAGYALALEPQQFSFPADHGPHPAFRNEWWYVTGNLNAASGERFGFELTIFRFALAPARDDEEAAASSAWATNQIFIGHFAVTDVAAEQFRVAQRYARGALGLAGAEADPFRVWVEDWHLQEQPPDSGEWVLRAADHAVELSLSLAHLKAPVPNGIDGLSQKSSERGNASYYYSIPRIRADGTLSIAGEQHEVSGLAWLDREWGSSALSNEQEGWDWFALQLADGSDLMYYNLRRIDGKNDPHSAGTWIPERGDVIHLAAGDVKVEVTDFWDSPRGGRYPMSWIIAVPRLDLVVQVDPVLDAQEHDTTVRYWEGAVDVAGVRAGRSISGRGYVELTGYAAD